MIQDLERLKKRILHLAISGQLVPQDPAEGTGEDLYREIQAEKARLVAEGKLKKQKELPPIRDEEMPFEIPKSWKWVRLGEIIHGISGGGTPSRDNKSYWQGNIPWLSVKDLKDHRYLENSQDHISIEGAASKPGIIKPAGSVIICTRMGLGKIAILKREAAINQDLKALLLSPHINPEYLIDYYSTLTLIGTGKGMTVEGIDQEKLLNFVIPLPPKVEQGKIVEKAKELFEYVDAAKVERKKIRDYTDLLEKKILHLAISGQLVPQDPAEGTGEDPYREIQAEKARLVAEGKLKKQKELPPIRDEEMPLEIPKSWKWVRLGDVVDVRDGTHDTPKYIDKGIPLVTSKNLCELGLNLSNVKRISLEDHVKISARSKVEKGDILFAMIGTIGNPVLIQEDPNFSIKNVALFKHYKKPESDISSEYLLYLLKYFTQNLREKSLGGVQPFVPLNLLRSYPIPLPPLKEQERITVKICNLDSKLTTIKE